MRILVTLHNFVPEPCFGAERVAMRQMREMLREGHEVLVFFAGRRDPTADGLAAEGLAGVRCVRVPYIAPKAQVLISIARPPAEMAFRRALREFQPDVVLFHHLVRLSLRLPAIARRAGVASALVLHDHYLVCPSYSLVAFDGPVCPGGSPARCARCLYAARFGRRVPPGVRQAAAALLSWRGRIVGRLTGNVDAVIAPSRSVIQEVEARGVRLRGAMVIPNGADVPERRHAPTLAGCTVRFGYLGAALPKKGIDVLGQACTGPLSQHLRIRGFRDEAAVAAFRRAHPACHASLELFSANVGEFFDQVDVVVVPSIWLENQPTTIIEAFAHGKPVVASRIGGIPEMFDDGRGGWMVPPGDPAALRKCMERLLLDPAETRRVVAGIPDWPSWSDVTAKVVRELERVVASRHGQSANGARP
jgi:glycosyltransferase involved in cell wall biosynthesis